MPKYFPKGTTGVVKKDDKCWEYVKDTITQQPIETPDETGFIDCNDCQGASSAGPSSGTQSSPASEASSPASTGPESVDVYTSCTEQSFPSVGSQSSQSSQGSGPIGSDGSGSDTPESVDIYTSCEGSSEAPFTQFYYLDCSVGSEISSGAAELIADQDYGTVIRVNGTCYFQFGMTNVPADFFGSGLEGTYSDCSQCDQQSSDAHVSSFPTPGSSLEAYSSCPPTSSVASSSEPVSSSEPTSSSEVSSVTPPAPEACNTSNANPSMFVTRTWTHTPAAGGDNYSIDISAFDITWNTTGESDSNGPITLVLNGAGNGQHVFSKEGVLGQTAPVGGMYYRIVKFGGGVINVDIMLNSAFTGGNQVVMISRETITITPNTQNNLAMSSQPNVSQNISSQIDEYRYSTSSHEAYVKEYLGCTYTNGQTREVFTTTYLKQTTGSPASPGPPLQEQQWLAEIDNDKFAMRGFAEVMGIYGIPIDYVKYDGVGHGAIGSFLNFWSFAGYDITDLNVIAKSPTGSYPFGGPFSFVGTYPFPGWGVYGDPGYIQPSQRSGLVTFSDGSDTDTIAWSEGNNW